MKRTVAAGAVIAGLVAAGCGSAPSSGTRDAAKLVPAGSAAFASLQLAPQGAEHADFEAAFGRLLGGDPTTELGKALVAATKEERSALDYSRDVKPWLGDQVALVLTGVRREGPDYAVLMASTDDDKARAAIAKDLAGTNAQIASYRGVDYRRLAGGIANGVVDHFLVAGTDAAFRAIVDTSESGSSLADSQAWRDSVSDRAKGKTGLAFLDIAAVLRSAVSRAPGAERILAPLAVGLLHPHPFVATLDARPDALVVDVSSPGTPRDKRGPGAASSPLIQTLPADAWFAAGLPAVGQALEKLAGFVKLNPLLATQYQRVVRQVRRQSGIDLEGDVLAGVGDVAVYARGTTAKAFQAGVIVSAREPAALRRVVSRLPRLLERTHGHSVEVRSAGPGAIAAYGAGAVRAALAPQARLGTSRLFSRAATALGARPTVFAAIAPLLRLKGRVPGHHHHRRHELTAAERARLAHVDFFAVGARRDGELDVVRIVLGLH